MSEPGVAVTGIGAICGLGRDAADIWTAVCTGRSAVAPLAQCAPHRGFAIDGYEPRELVADRKTLKLLRRTHMFGLYAGARAVEEAGFVAQRGALSADAAAAFNDRSGIYIGSGGGEYVDQYDYLPLLADSDGVLQRFGDALAQTVMDVAPADPAEQRALPPRHSDRLHRAARVHRQPQHQRRAGGRRGRGGGARGLVDRAVAVAIGRRSRRRTSPASRRSDCWPTTPYGPFDRHRNGCLLGEGRPHWRSKRAARRSRAIERSWRDPRQRGGERGRRRARRARRWRWAGAQSSWR
jgi:hypothetical protein